MIEFGKTIKHLRVEQKVSLRSVARKAGISAPYLSYLERGLEGPPSPTVIKSLAAALLVDADILFKATHAIDPEIANYLQARPIALDLIRDIKSLNLGDKELSKVRTFVFEIKISKAACHEIAGRSRLTPTFPLSATDDPKRDIDQLLDYRRAV